MGWLYDLPLWLLCSAIMFPSILFSLAGVRLVRQRGWMLGPDDTVSAGLAHAFVGVLYAVALGLMVVGVQGSYSEVEGVVIKEANLAGDLYTDLEGFAEPERSHLQGLTRRYVSSVIETEWPVVASGETSRETWLIADSIARGIIVYEPATPHGQVVFAEVLNGVNEMLDQRRERLFLGTSGVGAVTWVVVLIGAIVTISVAWFFYTPSAVAHYALVGTMAAMFGLMIFLIVAMDHPLRGEFSVEPEMFEAVLETMDHWDAESEAQVAPPAVPAGGGG